MFSSSFALQKQDRRPLEGSFAKNRKSAGDLVSSAEMTQLLCRFFSFFLEQLKENKKTERACLVAVTPNPGLRPRGRVTADD
ncbi:hypothetical protein BN381_370011 [Candidatus Microthrix parvicella RN1]|uniref:Uncharacterized protein n=1 Tax=Candidatus Neomicrothrix parvicella RN1 TaxID=1229780 RepID=R4Z130_9ACTN|nr:hypothetical protein BN381_370011 [Candidatus Microthrix parvicella RN1]